MLEQVQVQVQMLGQVLGQVQMLVQVLGQVQVQGLGAERMSEREDRTIW